MNSRSLAIVIHRIALATCCFAPAIALAQAGSSVAEFGDLVKSLLVPASAKPDPPSWSLGAHPAVRWNSATPQPSEAHLVNDGLPMSRTGVAQIAVKGQWNVTLAGSLASPLEVRLEMAQFDSSGGWLDPAAVLKEAGGFKVEATCKSGEISSGTSLYAVETAGYRPVLLAHTWSSGTAGTWMGMTFAYTKERAAKLKCE
ncbi:MAG: hypothetical protein ACREYF_20335 [Gammaproteobacteria bacterium]